MVSRCTPCLPNNANLYKACIPEVPLAQNRANKLDQTFEEVPENTRVYPYAFRNASQCPPVDTISASLAAKRRRGEPSLPARY
jgi:hypothetical protein